MTVWEVAFLGAIWGASFLFMRLSADDFGPVALVEVRLTLGALVLLPFLWRERSCFNWPLVLRLAGIGIINSAIPFILFAWAAQRAPAGIGAITNAMTVLFTVLVAFIFYGERIGTARAVGLLAGFIGVVVLASGKVAGVHVWPAAIAGTGAALCYGIGINVIRRHLSGISASAVAAATLSCASILLAPFAISEWPEHSIQLKSWISALALGVLCTGCAFVLFYRLIGRIGSARASAVTYLIPLFAVLWAWMVLSEPLTATMGIAGELILGGVALSQRS